MNTPDYMKLWHAALAREANLERELERLRRNATPAPDVDTLPILDALAAAQGQASDARNYARELEDTISGLRKIGHVRTALQADADKVSRKREYEAKAEALREAVENFNSGLSPTYRYETPEETARFRLRDMASQYDARAARVAAE